jgi:hypothetical protein
MLKARITRLAAFSRAPKSFGPTEPTNVSLTNELRETENYIEIVKGAISEIHCSELAQVIRDRKEEIASLQEQLRRSDECRKEKAREFREVTKELD